MITDQDITKLKKVFATNERVDMLSDQIGDLRIEFAELKETLDSFVDRLETKMDKFLGRIDRQDQENAAGAMILSRHTRKIKSLAKHTGLTLQS